jgi:hypothetical protein
MLTLHFCRNGSTTIVRYWPSVPRIGDVIALPELGGNLNTLRVFDVIWEGTAEPTVSVYVHPAKVDHAICNDMAYSARSHSFANKFLH